MVALERLWKDEDKLEVCLLPPLPASPRLAPPGPSEHFLQQQEQDVSAPANKAIRAMCTSQRQAAAKPASALPPDPLPQWVRPSTWHGVPPDGPHPTPPSSCPQPAHPADPNHFQAFAHAVALAWAPFPCPPGTVQPLPQGHTRLGSLLEPPCLFPSITVRDNNPLSSFTRRAEACSSHLQPSGPTRRGADHGNAGCRD